MEPIKGMNALAVDAHNITFVYEVKIPYFL